jgi:hypothetical protein
MNLSTSILNSAARSPRTATRAAQLRSSRLCAALLFLLLSFFTANAAQMRFGPYTNYDGTLITNFDLIYQAVGDPAIDAFGNVSGAIGLPKRVHLGADGMLTNTVQNQNIHVFNAPPTPYFFTANGYMFRAPLDSGPTIYSTTQPGVFITGMNYFVTLVMSNGTVSSITYNVITNALGFAPLPVTGTNGFIASVDATNISKFISNNLSNLLYLDYTTKLAQLTALSMTNAFATNAAGVQLINNRLYISTNYDAPLAAFNATNNIGLGSGLAALVSTNRFDPAGTALAIGILNSNMTVNVSNVLQAQIVGGATTLAQVTNVNNAGTGVIGTNGTSLTYKFSVAGTNAIIAIASPLTNGFVDKSITNNAATIAFAISLTNGLAGGGITAVVSTNIATNQVFLGTNALRIASGLSAFAPTNQFDVSGAAAIKANTNRPSISFATLAGTTTNTGTTLWPNSTAPGAGTMITSNQMNVIGISADSISSNTTNFVTLSGSLQFDFDAGEIDAYGGNIIIDHSGLYHGSLALASNLPPAGISTNGSAANQVLASVGGKTTFTNITDILGSTLGTSNVSTVVYTNALPALTNSFLTAINGNAQRLTVSNLTAVGPFRVAATNNGFLPLITDILTGPPLEAFFVFHGSSQTLIERTNSLGSAQIISQTPDAGFDFVNVASTIPNLSGVSYSWRFETNKGSAFPFYAQLTTNGFWATNFLGSGHGLTDTSASNLQAEALGQVAARIGASNAPIIATNLVLAATKMDETNGFSTNQIAAGIALEANLSFGPTGQATNIFGANPTNYIRFIGAGESSVTNGPFVWSAAGLLMNFISGDTLSYNGSSWLLRSNSVTLYTLAGASPLGAYSSISGVSPNPTAVATALIDSDGFAWRGFISPTNILAISNALQTMIISATNGLTPGGGGGGTGSNYVLNVNGGGTNNTFIFTNAAWGLSNSVQQSTARAGMFAFGGISNKVFAPESGVLGGFGNDIESSGSYNFISEGYSNSLIETFSGVIAGGQFNKINVGNFNSIGNGQSNRISGSGSTTATYSQILGGFNNAILLPSGGALDFSTIVGGQNSSITASGSTAIGSAITLSNANTIGVSDGTALSSLTNNQASFYFGNGYRFGGGPATFDGTVTAAGLSVSTITASAVANTGTFTNSGPASFLGTVTNFGKTYLRPAAAASSKTNWLFVDSTGQLLTNDFATLAASIAGGGGSLTPWPSDINGNGFALTGVGALNVTGGFTNGAWTASTLLEADANKKAISLANASGFLTNNGSGGLGYFPLTSVATTNQLIPLLGSPTSIMAAFDSGGNLVGTNNGAGLSNVIAFTHEGTSTNLNITFNGTLQSFTVTNGPDVWLNWSGANGSASFQVLTNVHIHSLTTFNKFLAGSNGVSTGVYQVTNGILSVTSYGGTNGAQLVPAIKENQ